MVNNVNGVNVDNMQKTNKKEPPYAELFKQHGISPDEVRQYLESKGISNPKELQEALQSGENPFNDFFAAKGISSEEVQAYEQTQNTSSSQKGNASSPKGPGGPPPEILQELQQYGLQPQGSLEADKAAIAAAKQQAGNGSATNTNFLSQETIQGFKTKNNLS